MKLHERMSAIGVLVALVCSNVVVSAEFGRIQGTFDVSPTGSASYKIPLWTPAGPQGVEPEITLVYDSQLGGGIAGVGWGLDAVPSIERCPRSVSLDGVVGTVQFNYDDRFCLRGNRLRLTSTPGTYGQAFSTYQLLQDDFTKITAYGTTGNGPTYFRAQSKNGLTYEYGFTDNSRVLPGTSGSLGTSVYRWLLNKVTDRDGNTMVVTYAKSVSSAVPTSIQWAPTSHGASTYLYEAKFSWDADTSKNAFNGFVGGFPVVNNYRLRNVEIRHAGTVARKYILEYSPGSATQGSRLTTLRECADSDGTICLLPTTFNYQDGVAGLTQGAGTVPTTSVSTLIADLNGDGRDDILYRTGGNWQAAFASGSGFAAPRDTGFSSTVLSLGKFSPNGGDSIVYNNAGTLYSVRYNGSSFVSATLGISHPSGSMPTRADVDGDGLHDFVWTSSSGSITSIMIRRNTTAIPAGHPTFAATPVVGASLPATALGGNVRNTQLMTSHTAPFGLNHLDVNGDGRQDLYVRVEVHFAMGAAPYMFTILSWGSSFSIPPSSTWTPPSQRTIVNVNGDACTDQLEGRVIQVASCNGTAGTTITIPGTQSLRAFLDWDGDNKTDVMVQNGTSMGVYPSLGTSFGALIPTTIPTTGTIQVFDQDGDNRNDLFRTTGTLANYYTATGTGTVGQYATHLPDLLKKVTDGFGNTTELWYVSTAQSNYSDGTPSSSSWFRKPADPLIVVGLARFSYGMNVGQTYDISYEYTGARYDAWAERDAGFEVIRQSDSRNSTTRDTWYDQTYMQYMLPKREEYKQSNGKLISSVLVEYKGVWSGSGESNRIFVYPERSTTQLYEVGGARDGAHITTRVIENLNVNTTYGNIGKVKVTLTDADIQSSDFGKQWVTTTDKTFSPPSVADWCIGLVTEVKVTKSAPALTDVVRTIGYTPDLTTKCRPTQEIVEPASSQYRVSTTFTYDSFGNVKQTDVVGRKPNPAGGFTDMDLRTTKFTWDTYGIYPVSEKNAENHDTSRVHDYAKGVLKEELDPNGLKTAWEYDAFGRETKQTRPDTTAHRTRYEDCSVSSTCGNNRRGRIWHEELAGNGTVIRSSYTVIDPYGRPIQEWGKTSNSSSSVAYTSVTTEYDALGRVARRSAPCLSSSCSTQYWTAYTYDLANRPIKIVRPASQTDSTPVEDVVYYEGRKLRISKRLATDSGGKITTYVSDVNGWRRSVRDPLGYGQDFSYDAAGSLTSITDSAGVPLLYNVEYRYGLGAFQTKSTDANMGPWTWTYDSLGNLVSWTDAKGASFSMSFDRLSRPLQRNEPGNSTTWTWGSSVGNYNVGKLSTISNTANGETFTETLTYDTKGRVAKRRFTVPGAGNFDYDYTYDDATGGTALLNTLEYPATVGTRLKLKYEYRFGELIRIRDANTSATPYWEVLKVNSWHMPVEEKLGNGLTTLTDTDAVTGLARTIRAGTTSNPSSALAAGYLYDPWGTVVQRQEDNLGLTENFYYDALFRLTSSTLRTGGGSPVTNATFTYKANGNIDTQLGGVTFDYATAQPGCTNYAHAQPHAVRKLTAPTWSVGYCYDQNGNAIKRDGQNLQWTSYNYLASVNASGSQSAQFSYGPMRDRWRMVYTRGSEIETTLYIGPSLERVTRPNGEVLYRHTVSAFGEAKAIVTRNQSGTETIRYVLSDQQGSVAAFAASDGSVQRSSFDAFGNRRNSTTWSGSPSPSERDALDAVTRQGYTYQTVLGAMGLNHMNGRVQDSWSGRFLSADPYVFEPFDTQAHNRYSYVYNNPLTLTDPSGFRTETRRGQQCFSVPMPPIEMTIYSDNLLTSGINYNDGRPSTVPPNTSNRREPTPLPRPPRFVFPPMVIGMQCFEYTYEVNIPDPPKEKGWLSRLADAANVVADFVPVVSQIKGVYEAYKVVTDPNASNLDKVIAAAAIVPGGKLIKYAEKGIDAAKSMRKLSRACCFVAGTMVLTEHGLRPIESIEIGDLVLARDELSGETALKPVTDLIRRFERDVWEVRLTVEEEDGTLRTITIETTDDHPWGVVDGDWVPTAWLTNGTLIERADGTTAEVTGVMRALRTAPTYNLEVADYHSYFVGEIGAWVHNGDDACDISTKRGGETAATAAGRRAHANYGTALGDKYDTKVTLPSGKKPDAVNWETREVRELKPDNPAAMRRGERQVEGYRSELEEVTGEPWTSEVDVYRSGGR